MDESEKKPFHLSAALLKRQSELIAESHYVLDETIDRFDSIPEIKSFFARMGIDSNRRRDALLSKAIGRLVKRAEPESPAERIGILHSLKDPKQMMRVLTAILGEEVMLGESFLID